ncbi:MAG: hypothetical protein M0C28_26305 [Candidatus Moduliflexus flocculans]|nr:hypothetical protein [Candidatus Moduliflexus flocculans]
MRYELPAKAAIERLSALGLGLPPAVGRRPGRRPLRSGPPSSTSASGCHDRTAWGVLNGGSATSYADRQEERFAGTRRLRGRRGRASSSSAPLCEGRPKGVTPAYINPDGSPGESFLVLKMRAAPAARRPPCRTLRQSRMRPVLPFFQMTSDYTDAELSVAYAGLREPSVAGAADRARPAPTRPAPRSARPGR